MDKPWMIAFLAVLEKTGIVSDAAKAAGVSSATVYLTRKTDADFEAAWDVALEVAVDAMELEARRRAVDGVTRHIYHQGNVVGEEQVYSDGLLQFLLKGRRRTVFGDKTEVTGDGGGPLKFMDETKKISRMAALLELAKLRKDIG